MKLNVLSGNNAVRFLTGYKLRRVTWIYSFDRKPWNMTGRASERIDSVYLPSFHHSVNRVLACCSPWQPLTECLFWYTGITEIHKIEATASIEWIGKYKQWYIGTLVQGLAEFKYRVMSYLVEPYLIIFQKFWPICAKIRVCLALQQKVVNNRKSRLH